MHTVKIKKWRRRIQSGVFLVGLMIILGFTSNGYNEKTIPSSSISADSSTWPAADTVLGGIPIYRSFNQLSPFFNFNNDTTYVINFWATWCKPCIEELPILEALHSKSKEKKIKVILVSLDFSEQVESKLVPFVQKQELQSTVLMLSDGNFNNWINKVSSEWSGAIPATYIYKGDQSQMILKKFDTLEELEADIQPFL